MILRKLTQVSEPARLTRRPRRLVELCEATGRPADEVAAVIQRFRLPGRSFLTPPVPEKLGPQTVIDISHESLIRQWSALSRLGLCGGRDRRVQTWLAQGADEWEADQRNDERLLTGVRLEEAKEWSARHEHRMKPVERDSSAPARRAGPRRSAAACWAAFPCLIVVVLLVAVTAVAFAVRSQSQQVTPAIRGERRPRETAQAQFEAAQEAERVKAEAERERKFRLARPVRGEGARAAQAGRPAPLAGLAGQRRSARTRRTAPESICRVRFANVLRRSPRREYILGTSGGGRRRATGRQPRASPSPSSSAAGATC